MNKCICVWLIRIFFGCLYRDNYGRNEYVHVCMADKDLHMFLIIGTIKAFITQSFALRLIRTFIVRLYMGNWVCDKSMRQCVPDQDL